MKGGARGEGAMVYPGQRGQDGGQDRDPHALHCRLLAVLWRHGEQRVLQPRTRTHTPAAAPNPTAASPQRPTHALRLQAVRERLVKERRVPQHARDVVRHGGEACDGARAHQTQTLNHGRGALRCAFTRIGTPSSCGRGAGRAARDGATRTGRGAGAVPIAANMALMYGGTGGGRYILPHHFPQR